MSQVLENLFMPMLRTPKHIDTSSFPEVRLCYLGDIPEKQKPTTGFGRNLLLTQMSYFLFTSCAWQGQSCLPPTQANESQSQGTLMSPSALAPDREINVTFGSC